MTSGKQKLVEKNKDIEKRYKALEAIRAVRQKIAQAHGSFPEINSLIRRMREDSTVAR